ncbi:hypothetical protein AUJ78_00085 [Candidatus Peregrinibacteria bacterium CG1_02_41_10]|nr:MAG: hypothetical protein AUJ78_00085 [Candidatus Peregrinibacteria bacterium CG1_02_41_10]
MSGGQEQGKSKGLNNSSLIYLKIFSRKKSGDSGYWNLLFRFLFALLSLSVKITYPFFGKKDRKRLE